MIVFVNNHCSFCKEKPYLKNKSPELLFLTNICTNAVYRRFKLKIPRFVPFKPAEKEGLLRNFTKVRSNHEVTTEKSFSATIY